MRLELALTLIGAALFFGGFAGMLTMGMFASNLRIEKDAFELENIRLRETEKQYDFLNEKYQNLINHYDSLQKKYQDLINKEQ